MSDNSGNQCASADLVAHASKTADAGDVLKSMSVCQEFRKSMLAKPEYGPGRLFCDVCFDDENLKIREGKATNCKKCQQFFGRSLKLEKYKTYECSNDDSCRLDPVKDGMLYCQKCRFELIVAGGWEIKEVPSGRTGYRISSLTSDDVAPLVANYRATVGVLKSEDLPAYCKRMLEEGSDVKHSRKKIRSLLEQDGIDWKHLTKVHRQKAKGVPMGCERDDEETDEESTQRAKEKEENERLDGMEKIEAEKLWDTMEEEVRKVLNGEVEEDMDMAPIDSQLDVGEDVQKRFAMVRVQRLLRALRPRTAVSLYLAARAFFQDDEVFGGPDISIEEEMSQIKAILLADLKEVGSELANAPKVFNDDEKEAFAALAEQADSELVNAPKAFNDDEKEAFAALAEQSSSPFVLSAHSSEETTEAVRVAPSVLSAHSSEETTEAATV